MQQCHSSTDGGSLSAFLQGLVQRHVESVLAANEPEPGPELVKMSEEVQALVVSCCERVKVMAWMFARSSDGRVDVEEMYSIGMLEICEAVAAGRGIHADDPVVYLSQVARYAMGHEWRRLHDYSTSSLDAPLSNESSLTLYDVFPSPDVAVPSSPTPSKRVQALNGAIRRLASARQRAVLRRRYGLPGYGVHDEKETMRELHATRPAVDHARRDGLRKLVGDAQLCQVIGVEVQ